jgi:TetR/AcrR family transcriptional regulator, transcriptional repressor for nem operon
MRFKPDHKDRERPRIVAAAGRRFRQSGYGGASAAEVMAEAGLTTGALYTQFRSKAELMQEVIAAGLARVVENFGGNRARDPKGWFVGVAERYLSREHRNRVAAGCVLPTLTLDAGRMGPDTQRAYKKGLQNIVATMEAGLPDTPDMPARDRAIAALALFAGGVLLARAVPDGRFSEEILAACRKAALTLGTTPDAQPST